jgi:hypothetical protein
MILKDKDTTNIVIFIQYLSYRLSYHFGFPKIENMQITAAQFNACSITTLSQFLHRRSCRNRVRRARQTLQQVDSRSFAHCKTTQIYLEA